MAHLIQVADEVGRLRVQRDARRALALEERGPIAIPPAVTLRARLAVARPPVAYRIAGLQPAGSRVLLAAQFKAGKTTLVGNAVRCLADGDDFLDAHVVMPVVGTVAILDTEMSEAQGEDWLSAQGIRHDDKIVPFFLRGRVAALDVCDPAVRAEWAEALRAVSAEYLVLDCLRPVLDALGLDEHKDAGRFLVAFDALLVEAGIAEALVVHHMGHAGERARGDSRLRDWPDAEWRLVRKDDNPDSARYFAAYGRDVDVSESRLTFTLAGRRLSRVGGSRKDADAEAALTDILAVLGHEALSGRAVEDACAEAGTTHGRATIRAALALGVRTGALMTERGPKNAQLHRAASAPVRGSAPPLRQRTGASQCASAPVLIEARRAAHSLDEPFVFDPKAAPGDEQ